MGKLGNLKPERVFYYFEELSKIPRESGNEKAVSDYLVETGKKLGLEVYQDEVWNVVMRKKLLKAMKIHRELCYKVTWIWFVKKNLIAIMTS